MLAISSAAPTIREQLQIQKVAEKTVRVLKRTPFDEKTGRSDVVRIDPPSVFGASPLQSAELIVEELNARDEDGIRRYGKEGTRFELRTQKLKHRDNEYYRAYFVCAVRITAP